MFDELNKYKHNGNFTFKLGDNLREKSKDVLNLPGFYYKDKRLINEFRKKGILTSKELDEIVSIKAAFEAAR